MVKDFDFSSFSGKSILITGGFGLTGNNLTRRLVSLGAKVTLLTKSFNNESNVLDVKNAVEVILGDIADYDLIKTVVVGKDYIFLLAGQPSVSKSMEDPFYDLEVNCKATLNVLESCRKNNSHAKIVFAGTVREAGQIKGSRLREDFRENPVSLFDLHKLTSEKYLQIYHKVYGMKTVTLRFSNVFGKVQYSTDPHVSVINHFVKTALISKKLDVYGDGGPKRDYNYVENVVDALLLVAQSQKTNGEFYVLGSGEGITFKEFLDSLKKILIEKKGINLEVNRINTPEIISKTVQGDVIVDYSKLQKDVGYFPKVDFYSGLEQTVDFYSGLS